MIMEGKLLLKVLKINLLKDLLSRRLKMKLVMKWL